MFMQTIKTRLSLSSLTREVQRMTKRSAVGRETQFEHIAKRLCVGAVEENYLIKLEHMKKAFWIRALFI